MKSRSDTGGEVANQQIHMPGILPKVPGRFYYYFGKPIETEGTPGAYFMTRNSHDMWFHHFNLLRY